MYIGSDEVGSMVGFPGLGMTTASEPAEMGFPRLRAVPGIPGHMPGHDLRHFYRRVRHPHGGHRGPVDRRQQMHGAADEYVQMMGPADEYVQMMGPAAPGAPVPVTAMKPVEDSKGPLILAGVLVLGLAFVIYKATQE